MEHIEKLLLKCPEDHPLFKAYHEYRHFFWQSTFLTHLETALSSILAVCPKAYNDMVKNKLPAVHGKSFDRHSLVSALCEVCLMNTFIGKSTTPESFIYEPKLRDGSSKNVEFSILINGVRYNVEVKAPNLNNYYTELIAKLGRHPVVTRFDTRSFGKPKGDDQMGSPSMRVKDFLVDADLKFPASNLPNEVNVLFIAWDSNSDQPCIDLKHPLHGLLTPNSWHTDDKGSVILFPNIDLIFVSDLYGSIIAHLSSADDPIPGMISGVPYFERYSHFRPEMINPFYLHFSRNVLIRPSIDLSDHRILSTIWNLPITLPSDDVTVIDEENVGRYGIDIKFSFRNSSI